MIFDVCFHLIGVLVHYYKHFVQGISGIISVIAVLRSHNAIKQTDQVYNQFGKFFASIGCAFCLNIVYSSRDMMKDQAELKAMSSPIHT